MWLGERLCCALCKHETHYTSYFDFYLINTTTLIVPKDVTMKCNDNGHEREDEAWSVSQIGELHNI